MGLGGRMSAFCQTWALGQPLQGLDPPRSDRKGQARAHSVGPSCLAAQRSAATPGWRQTAAVEDAAAAAAAAAAGLAIQGAELDFSLLLDSNPSLGLGSSPLGTRRRNLTPGAAGLSRGPWIRRCVAALRGCSLSKRIRGPARPRRAVPGTLGVVLASWVGTLRSWDTARDARKHRGRVGPAATPWAVAIRCGRTAG